MGKNRAVRSRVKDEYGPYGKYEVESAVRTVSDAQKHLNDPKMVKLMAAKASENLSAAQKTASLVNNKAKKK